jgi:hypothetical protein
VPSLEQFSSIKKQIEKQSGKPGSALSKQDKEKKTLE